MARDLSHIMMMEVDHKIGPYTMEEVVLYNANRLTEQEAYNFVAAGEYSDYVLAIPKSQWIELFCNGAKE